MANDAHYVYTVNWCIEGLPVHPNLEGDRINSRPFTISGLENSRWRLELHLKCGTEEGQKVSLHFRRLPTHDVSWLLSPEEIIVDISIRLGLKRPLSTSRKCFKVFDSFGIDTVLKDYAMHEGRGWDRINFSCNISPSTPNIMDCRDDLVRLSRDMTEMFINPEYFDTILICEGLEFKVHRNVLACRCKALLQYLDLDRIDAKGIVTVNLDIIPSNVLQTILSFVYTGALDISLAKVTNELLNSASRFNLIDLKRKLQTYPKVIQLENRVSYEKKHLRWILPRGDGVSNRRYVRKMAIEIPYLDELIITCQTARHFLHSYESCCQFSFKIVGFNADIPIHLDCKVTCTAEKLQKFMSWKFLKNNETKWNWEFLIRSSEPLQQLEILTDIIISDGVTVVTSQSHWSQVENTGISDFRKLSHDLFCMFNEEMYGYILLRCGRGEFKVHKNILHARAPKLAEFIFAKMQESEVSNIDDINENILRILCIYLYQGRLADLDYSNLVIMNTFARKHSIIHLRTICLARMIKILCDVNLLNLLRY